MQDLRRKLKEKEEELVDLKSFTQVVSVTVQSNNDELQETCKELFKGLKELPQDAHIGVKRIGELDCKTFYNATKRIYSKTIAEERALDLCLMWEEHLQDPNWYPFKVITIHGLSQEVIDEEDRKLKCLKRDLGDTVYKVVTTALMDINHYKPDKRFFKEELWNFSESRKATLKEGVSCFLKMCDRATHEPKSTVIIYSRRNNRAT